MSYQNLKCSELKDLLAKRGLPSHGKKNELLERLINHEKDNPNSINQYILDSNKGNSEQGISYLEASSSTDVLVGNQNNSEINVVEPFEKENIEEGNIEEENNNYMPPSSPSYIGSQKKKKILSVNTREKEYNKPDIGKMKNYFKNILTSNVNVEESKYYGNDNSKSDDKTYANKNLNLNNDEEKKTKIVIPKITFSETSLSTKNILEKNIISPPEDNLYLTEEKKRELRKKRFGVVSTDDALESRAKRFCIVTQKMEEENKKKRAERFGLNKGKLNDFEMKKKRAERFGLVNESDKLKARALRFGMTQ
ncbi:hypothetical protein, conserved [Plasmodium gonderi]|uniref:SAP domain-containing protein n=1 Tax=Plasmodium gonderi TaxID=77519 RepID=A0A1Y1JCD5_PLAGO|nr:hypothetical protein, conserved [Plasmodium gonderi]GAW80189.1 hypothetical protein, conserved [Plasmodium gonderi]